MSRPKHVDEGFRLITQLSDIQDLSQATAIRPNNLKETSELRLILHGLGLKHTLSRTSKSSLDKRLQDAKLKGLQWLPVGSKYYAIQLVEALCILARAALRSNVNAQVVHPPHPLQQSVHDASGAQLPNNILKRKLSGTSLSADTESLFQDSKRQMMAVNSHESSIVQEGEDRTMAKSASETPYATPMSAHGSHALSAKQVLAQFVSISDVKPPKTGYAGTPKPKLYTSKAEFEADRALVKHKHGLAKARTSRKPKEARHDMPRAALVGIAPDTPNPASNTFGADDAADSDVEDDDKAGDGSEVRAGTDTSTWHTSTTYRDHREDCLTLEQATKADALATSCPLELWRVSAATGSHHTQGSTSQQHIKPPAAVEGLKSGAPIYHELSDFPSLSAASRNLAGRLLCTQSNSDQFTSYTTSLPFALVLARRREAFGQGDISITRVATRQVTTRTGEQAKFFFVPELLDILGIVEWEGLSERSRRMLMGTRFHHEYVALGELDLTNNPYRPVMFDQLKAHGLYDFRAGLHIEGNEVEEKKLYYRRLQLSHQWYGPEAMPSLDGDASHFTGEHLEHAAELARLFDTAVHDFGGNGRWSDNTTSAPLSIFLDFAGLFRRPKNNQLFAGYIRDTYSKDEVQSILYEGMERIPNNSPDRLQVMDRTREACVAVGLREPQATEVMLVDTLFDFDGAWHGDLEKITGSIAPWKRAAESLKPASTPIASWKRPTKSLKQASTQSVSPVENPSLLTAPNVNADNASIVQHTLEAASFTKQNAKKPIYSAQDFYSRFRAWFAMARFDIIHNDLYGENTRELFDEDVRMFIFEYRWRAEQGIYSRCWISGISLPFTCQLLTAAATLVEAELVRFAGYPIRMAAIREMIKDDWYPYNLDQGHPWTEWTRGVHGGCPEEGCGVVCCGPCSMKIVNGRAREELERQYRTLWKLETASYNTAPWELQR
ncbi:hypothetical protein LTR10_004030 [Elasticomyces elasticus]|nr:hypothetical protein LTR10_004030 [Elasticomyces elasticus]KAK4977782.1 hypothetical protein LTR42_002157 [Elasticomyces elasticus]